MKHLKDATEEDGDDAGHLGDLRREVAGVGEEEEEAGLEERQVPHTAELRQQGGQHSCKADVFAISHPPFTIIRSLPTDPYMVVYCIATTSKPLYQARESSLVPHRLLTVHFLQKM